MFVAARQHGGAQSLIAKIEFYAIDSATNTSTLIGTATAAPYFLTWNSVPVGNYTLTAVATDVLGISSTSAAINVTAIANVPPTVSLTSPANGATVKVPGSFTLTANAASTTSGIAKVEFYASSNASGTTTNTLIGTVTTAVGGSYSYTWSNVPLGTYSLTAKVTDTLNASTTSSPITVTVNTGIAQAYYIHTDHLDSPRQITDTAGNVVWDWENLDPFGNNIPNENPANQGAFEFPLRFAGQYFDKETGLHQNYFRDYDPALGGRYIESDPIGLAGGSFSTFTYAVNNPLMQIDPLGLANGPAIGWMHPNRQTTPGYISIGAGGAGNLGVLVGGADSGFAFDNRGHACFYTNTCTGGGWNTIVGGSIGVVGSVGIGSLSSGTESTCGGYVGPHQVLGNNSGISYGRGILGPTTGTGAGYMSCTTNFYCMGGK